MEALNTHVLAAPPTQAGKLVSDDRSEIARIGHS